MNKIKYNVHVHNAHNPSSPELEFIPYVNELSLLNEDPTGWITDNVKSITLDPSHPITLDSAGALKVMRESNLDTLSIAKTVTLTPSTKYYFSMYLRNNAVASSVLKVNDIVLDDQDHTKTNRVSGTFTTTAEGTTEIKLEMYDPDGPIDAWIDGLFATPLQTIHEGKTKEELEEAYPYVREKKDSPTAYDLLSHILHGSPYKYYIKANGRRVLDYNKPLIDYGIDQSTSIVTGIAEWDEQIFNAFVNNIPLMAMLEGKRDHVSHAYPKEDNSMSNLHNSHFPRVQFFTGFAVNKVITDTRPFADEVNFVNNIYIPVSKVMNSVSGIMILNQTSAIMSELGWSKVRGSDYFLKNEQLYVLQTQYLQDQIVRKYTN